MPKTVIIDLQADIGDVKKQLDAVNKSLKGVQDTSEETKKTLKETPAAVNKIAKSFKGVGLAIKAMGIGLVLEAFSLLKGIFSENQKVMDIFNIALETMKILFNDVIDFVFKLKDPLVKLFEDPMESLKKFATMIKQNLITRVEGLLELIPKLGEAFKLLFSGEFAAAGKVAADAVAKATLGVEDFTDKVVEFGEAAVETISEVTESVTSRVKQATANAKTLVALRKQLIIDEAKLEEITLRNLKLQEDLRQERDDERLSIEQRIEANKLLGEQLQKQAEEEQKLIEKTIRLRQMEAAVDPNNVEKQAEVIRAKNQLLELEERINGFKSEQLINEVALNKEAAERNQLIADRANIGEEDALKQIENERAKLDAYIATLNEGTIAYEQALNDRKALDVAATKEEERRAQQLADAKVALSNSVFDVVKTLAADNEALVKGISAAQVIMNTAVAVMTALKDPTLVGPARFLAAATVAATGAAQLATVLRTSSDTAASGGGGGGGISGGAPSIGVIAAGQNPNEQIVDALNTQGQEPVKAYVVTKEVTTGQELDRNLVRNASLGG